MIRLMPTTAVLFSSLSIAALSGCEQIEQAATEAAAQARQSAAEVFDEAVRTGSLEQAGQKARESLQQARAKAAVMLDQASRQLAGEAAIESGEAPDEQPPTEAL